jgi:capsular exopolysaccharide synthesis family protein
VTAGRNEEIPQRATPEELAERALLITALALTPAQVAEVSERAARLQVSFAAALIELGLATSRDVELLIRASFRQPIPAERAVILHPTAQRRGNWLAPLPRLTPHALPSPTLLAASSAHTEALRAMRTELLLRLGPREDGTALAIVSTARGDGRTQLAAELAISFAQLKRTVLLIDADLRRPHLGDLLLLDVQTPGLAAALDSDKPPECFQVQGLPTLHYMPSGTPDESSLELFSYQRFRTFIEGCRKEFDFVIIDTPATETYADGLAIASATGFAVLVTRGSKTATRDARQLLEKLDVAGARVLGAVLNHF